MVNGADIFGSTVYISDRGVIQQAPPSYNRIFQCYPNPPGYFPAHFVPGL